jgi:hypothetical protein
MFNMIKGLAGKLCTFGGTAWIGVYVEEVGTAAWLSDDSTVAWINRVAMDRFKVWRMGVLLNTACYLRADSVSGY